jgi:hypothetical protein
MEKATIQPFQYKDLVTKNKIRVSVSPYFTKLTINEREYYFEKETGKFDGTAMPMKG